VPEFGQPGDCARGKAVKIAAVHRDASALKRISMAPCCARQTAGEGARATKSEECRGF